MIQIKVRIPQPLRPSWVGTNLVQPSRLNFQRQFIGPVVSGLLPLYSCGLLGAMLLTP